MSAPGEPRVRERAAFQWLDVRFPLLPQAYYNNQFMGCLLCVSFNIEHVYLTSFVVLQYDSLALLLPVDIFYFVTPFTIFLFLWCGRHRSAVRARRVERGQQYTVFSCLGWLADILISMCVFSKKLYGFLFFTFLLSVCLLWKMLLHIFEEKKGHWDMTHVHLDVRLCVGLRDTRPLHCLVSICTTKAIPFSIYSLCVLYLVHLLSHELGLN